MNEDYSLPAPLEPDVLKSAICAYGSSAQIDMAIEEMSELTKAMLKKRRADSAEGPDSIAALAALSNIREEMADVIIMLTQLMMIYGDRNTIGNDIEKKILRLKRRLEKKFEEENL